jgi:hypothetical protein
LRNLVKKIQEKDALDDVRNFSKLVNNRLEELNKNDELKIKQMNIDELNDLNKLLQIADYILCSYEEKKDLHSILKKFVGIINESIYSIEKIDDKTNELIISADSTITKIKDHQTSMNKPLLNTNKSEKH